MKYSILLVALFIVGLKANGQKINFFPDSIRIELPDQKTVAVIEMKKYQDNPDFIKNFPAFIKETMEYVKKSSPSDFGETGPYRIDVRIVPAGEKEILSAGNDHSYKPIGEKTLIAITKIDELKTQVTVKEKQIIELLPPGWEMKINSETYKVTLYSESFQSMVSVGGLDFTDLSAQLIKDSDFASIGKKSIRSRIVFRENKIDQNTFSRKYPGDNLLLGGSGGIGIYGDKIYPQLSATLGLMFNDRFSRRNIRISALYDYLFFAEKITEGYQINGNGFLSLTFEKNFNKKTTSAQWAGIGAGILTNRTGSYFTGNTLKLFVIHHMEGSGISIVPEFYWTDDYKKFTFGTTLRYTF